MSIDDARSQRAAKAELLRALETGDVTLREILERPPDALANVPIHRVIERVPRMGRARTESLLKTARVWPTHTLGILTDAERRSLVRNLPPRLQ